MVTLSTRRKSSSWGPVNPATCTGPCGVFSAVLASSGYVVFDIVNLLVNVPGGVWSDPSGNAGTGVLGLDALDSWNMSCSASTNVLVLISS